MINYLKKIYNKCIAINIYQMIKWRSKIKQKEHTKEMKSETVEAVRERERERATV